MSPAFGGLNGKILTELDRHKKNGKTVGEGGCEQQKENKADNGPDFLEPAQASHLTLQFGSFVGESQLYYQTSVGLFN